MIQPSKSPVEANALDSLRNVQVKIESFALELAQIEEKIVNVEKVSLFIPFLSIFSVASHLMRNTASGISVGSCRNNTKATFRQCWLFHEAYGVHGRFSKTVWFFSKVLSLQYSCHNLAHAFRTCLQLQLTLRTNERISVWRIKLATMSNQVMARKWRRA